MSTPSITLYYKQGTSDKVYQASIEPAGPLFVVNFAFGRRGSTLSTGTKTPSPVPFEAAQKIYNKLIQEKTAKGYTQGEDGTPYQHGPKEELFTGILPMLLNPVEESEVQRLINDGKWAMQEKFDGKRIILSKSGDSVQGINRKGITVGLPATLIQAALSIQCDFILDGESIGDDYHAFDLLSIHGKEQRQKPCYERLMELTNLLIDQRESAIKLVETAFVRLHKLELYNNLKAWKREGVVFKLLSAEYTPDRPNIGGPALKHKFYATLSAMVTGINDCRSVEIQLKGLNGWQRAGNVTIPANRLIPPKGSIVELRYLYTLKASGVLYQPVFLGQRTDLEPEDCLATQLKFKPDTSDASQIDS